MDIKYQELNELKLKKSKICTTDVNSAITLLYESYIINNDMKRLISELFEFSFKVIGAFTERYIVNESNINQMEFLRAYIESDEFKVDSTQSYIFTAIELCNRLIVNNKFNNVIINIILELSKRGYIRDKVNSNLKNYFDKFMESKGDKFLRLDFQDFKSDDNRLIFKLILDISDNVYEKNYITQLKEWCNKYNFQLPKESINDIKNRNEEPGISNNNLKIITDKITVDKEQIDNIKANSENELNSDLTRLRGNHTEVSKEVKKEINKNIVVNNENILNKSIQEGMVSLAKFVEKINEANNELNILFDKIFERNMTIAELESKIDEKNKLTTILKNDINEKENKINLLNYSIEKHDEILKEKEDEIIELNDRLKNAFNSDEFNRNQELITLKKNLSNSLKLQYADFTDLNNLECNEDNYEALKIILNQIFRILGKYGVEF